MIEAIRSKRVATAAVVLFGGGVATGCGNIVEGIGNVPMVHCSSKKGPRSNGVDISAAPKGVKIQMGNKIVTDEKGHYPAAGDFVVTSQGNGNFKVSVTGSANGDNNSAEIVPSLSSRENSITVTDNHEQYVISGATGPQGSTALSVIAKCL